MNSAKTLKRLEALHRAKKIILDQESLEFASIRKNLKYVIEELSAEQSKYMDGVRKINEIRQSNFRTSLKSFEESVDLTKSRWIDLYKKKQSLEDHLEKKRMFIVRAKKQLNDLDEKKKELAMLIDRDRQKREDQIVTDNHHIYKARSEQKGRDDS